jgi:hypothetical protein
MQLSIREQRSCTGQATLSGRGPAVFPAGRVEFPFTALAWLLVVTALAEIGEDAGLLALLLESSECSLEMLVVTDDDF